MVTILGVSLVAVVVFLNFIVGTFLGKRWLPLTAAGLGILVSFLSIYGAAPGAEIVVMKVVLEGLVIGGLAMGAFDVGKKTVLGK